MAKRSAKTAEIKGMLGEFEAIKIESLGLQPLIDLRMEFDNIEDSGSSIKLFARAARSHWQVENKLHWQLDYTFTAPNGSVPASKRRETKRRLASPRNAPRR